MEKSDAPTLSRMNTNPQECWEVYLKVLEETKTLDEYLDEESYPCSYNEGEQEAEWLKVAGLEELIEPWKEGKEIQLDELSEVLHSLSRAQAEAVKRRVRSLNHTVKQCYNQRQKVRKPDIRDVFKDSEVSSTGTRSRSATPDSLDSVSGEAVENTSSPSTPTVVTPQQENTNTPSFVTMFYRHSNENKEEVRRTPKSTVNVTNSVSNPNSIPLPIQDIFRRSAHWSHRCDVADGDSEGIKLMAYQRLGTVNLSRSSNQGLCGSDPSGVSNVNAEFIEKSMSKNSTLRRSIGSHATITRSHSSLYGSRLREDKVSVHPLNRTSSHGHLSFEEMCRANETKHLDCVSNELSLDVEYSQLRIELLSQRDITRLQPLLWLELTAVFDKYNLPLVRRKPNKRRRKSGNVFGVSLSTLLLRDSQLTSEENNIPLIFQKIFYELTSRGCKEEGILRVGGHKQKVEALCTQLETDFYAKPRETDQLLTFTPCHDLSVVLKKLLRDLPQPLLTVEYIDAFFQTHGVRSPNELSYSLNLLVLLLPVEHRSTLKAFLAFLKLIVENQSLNKMSIHNVAMIMAPSLFPPRYIYPKNHIDLSAQVNIAALCCQVTEAIFTNFDRLWDVPKDLIEQLSRQAKEERYKKLKKKIY